MHNLSREDTSVQAAMLITNALTSLGGSNEFVINQVIDNNLIALAKIYAHKNRYDLLLNKSRLTMLFNNALNANKLLNVEFNAQKLEKKKQYVIELSLQQLEQYIMILFDLTKKQDNDNKQ